MRKPRSDSKLANLPAAQRDQVASWLLDDGLSYCAVTRRLRSEFQISLSHEAVRIFYRSYCMPLRLRRAAAAAAGLPELAGSLMLDWDESSIILVKQKYFELLAAARIDPKELRVFAIQIAAINRAKLDREKLEFDRQKLTETVRLRERALAFQREKFEFDAARKAIEHAREIKTIAADRSLDSNARLEQVRRRLFPQLAEEAQTP